MSRRKRRRNYGTPIWAPKQVDASINEVKPLQGWVMMEERFDQDRVATVAGLELQIASPNTNNTVYGTVLAMNVEDAEKMGIYPGDVVIYREWSGGRWQLRDKTVLLMEAEHVVAKVD